MLNNRDNEVYFVWLRELLAIRYESQLRSMEPIQRECFLYRKVLEEIPIHIANEDLFAGCIGYPRNEPFPPHIQAELEEHARRHAAWLERKKQRPPTTRELWRDWNLYLKASGNTTGHCLMGYQRVVSEGLNAYVERIRAELRREDNTPEKIQMLQAMEDSLDAAAAFCGRFANLAEQLAAEETDDAGRQRLLRIARMCRKVPFAPAEDFLEALQSIYMTHILTELSEPSFTTVSLGNLDRILGPFYKKDEEPTYRAAIAQLYRELEDHSGRDCSISLGGTDAQGQDVTNEVSYLFLNGKSNSTGVRR